METYRKFFNIDPDYFPAVNEDVIKKNQTFGRNTILMRLL